MYLPNNVEFVLNTLNNNGFSAYVVGECVREYLLGNNPSNYEIATSALPEQIRNAFSGYHVKDT